SAAVLATLLASALRIAILAPLAAVGRQGIGGAALPRRWRLTLASSNHPATASTARILWLLDGGRNGCNKFRCRQQAQDLQGLKYNQPLHSGPVIAQRLPSAAAATAVGPCTKAPGGKAMNVREAASGATAPLPLTFACGLYDRMLRLYTREVVPAG